MRRHGFSSRRFSVSIDESDEANKERTCLNPCRVFALPIFLYTNVATTSTVFQYTAHWTMYRHRLYGRYQAASIHATRESRVKRVNMVGECECATLCVPHNSHQFVSSLIGLDFRRCCSTRLAQVQHAPALSVRPSHQPWRPFGRLHPGGMHSRHLRLGHLPRSCASLPWPWCAVGVDFFDVGSSRGTRR